ncbi:alpha-mannosidase [Candidatus Nomurabacteria bacterium]|nr:alpha-mannosidase [Candidatus Nomurabacteria bacterium]
MIPGSKVFTPIAKGDIWGDNKLYAWFKCSLTIDESLSGRDLWIVDRTGSIESLLFINGRPDGIFDFVPDIVNPHERIHREQLLTKKARYGQRYEVHIEGYSGHECVGFFPGQTVASGIPYPVNKKRIFDGVYLAQRDEEIFLFSRKLRALINVFEAADDHAEEKWRAFSAVEKIFRVLPGCPEKHSREEIVQRIKSIEEDIDSNFRYSKEKVTGNYVGVVGHSHLDTAWAWPVEETLKKGARTFSNSLKIMRNKPDYRFVQSSVLYLHWMEKYYPDIFDEISERIKQGRWEPNGGAWVECDGNMVSGECMIRQFLKGQRYTREKFGFESDCFWLPDTFGYSGAIPQIMKGCKLDYFLTTKLSWNDTNDFPFTSFNWRGIDGTQVLVHFNLIHTEINYSSVSNAIKGIRNKQNSLSRLMAYGFGDGGGGPRDYMVDDVGMTSDIQGTPVIKHTSVSDFMHDLAEKSDSFPVFDGELYMEGHRGTLTSMHEIKRSNRLAETALRNLELAAVLKRPDSDLTEKINEWYEMLLMNQFHDILPGTSIPEVHDTAIRENYGVIRNALEMTDRLIGDDKKTAGHISIFNPLSWEIKGQTEIPFEGFVPDGVECQIYEDLKGHKITAVSDLELQPFSNIDLRMEKSDGEFLNNSDVFHINDNRIETPFAIITLDEYSYISGFYDKSVGRELTSAGELPFNTFIIGEDIPKLWDAWDIDADQKLKMKPVRRLVSSEVVSNGPLRLVVRNKYAAGDNSFISQDMIFYSDTPKIDFHTLIDWKEKNKLLKVCFSTDLRATSCKNDIQFGFIERNTTANNIIEQARFEVCNHKWTDISETGYGIALLNDCKYGISVSGSQMCLTLLKSGCHPDPRGDEGVHEMTYSLLPHNSGFGADPVIHPAYELNIRPIVTSGRSEPIIAPFRIDPSNIIIESVKFAEDNDGIVLRLYECEKRYTNAVLKLDIPCSRIAFTNMLEDVTEDIRLSDSIELKFSPFEIKTIKIFY